MSIDRQLLEELRRYDDEDRGISEEFLARPIGRAEAIGVLARPLGDSRRLGWVICPSLGSEQASLRRLEGLVARGLAAAGFPSVRLRHNAQRPRELSLAARLAEAEAAVGLLSDEPGVDAVGVAGGQFGATAAALLADRLELPAMALWEPIQRGKRYVQRALRFQRIAGLLGGPDGSRPERGASALDEVTTVGVTDVRGFRLTRPDYDDIAAVDLLHDVKRFRGRSLLVGVSAGDAPDPALQRLADHLTALGGEARVEVVEDPLVTPFGEHYYRNVGVVRIDTRLEVDRKLAQLTAAWASEVVTAAGQHAG